MKHFFRLSLTIFILFSLTSIFAQSKLDAYYKVTTSGSVNDIKAKIKTAMKAKGFTYIGSYNPEGKSTMAVVAFTRKDIYGIALYGYTHKAMASIIKFGIIKKGSTVTVSLLNPEYIFYAYLRNTTSKYAELKKISDEAVAVLKEMGTNFTGFGGKLSKSELKDYHYMIGMPYFIDPVELKEFSTFDDVCATIEKNLAAKKNNTARVYRLKFAKSQICIYGVALKSTSKGEPYFLPIIGEDNIAAMPYEIVVVKNKALMLHGKYRLALHWPELTMGQFMKISSTPGDIEDILKSLTE